MQAQAKEFGTGLFVFLGLAALLFLATQTTNLDKYFDDAGYVVTARFSDVAGLRARSPVTMAGVNIGRVERIDFDKDRLDAVVTLRINSTYDTIPEDSSASILTAGLLGSKYIGLTPGGADESLTDNSEIYLTQSAIVLETLVSRFLFGGGE